MPYRREDELAAIGVREIGRWGRIIAASMGAEWKELPEPTDVRPERVRDNGTPATAGNKITDLSDPRLAAFFSRTG